MANLKLAMPFIKKFEGGYTRGTEDIRGGETYMGISRNNFPDWLGWDTIDQLQSLNEKQTVASLDPLVDDFYCSQFWLHMHGNAVNSQYIAIYILDFFVNAGHNAIKTLQTVIGAEVDGIVGTATVDLINSHNESVLLRSLHEARKDYYSRIGAVGTDSHKFLAGWLHRADTLYQQLTTA